MQKVLTADEPTKINNNQLTNTAVEKRAKAVENKEEIVSSYQYPEWAIEAISDRCTAQ
jgi:hypothetical protein